MIYSVTDIMMFSLISNDITTQNKYSKPIINQEFLYSFFDYTLKNQINIFSEKRLVRREIIKEFSSNMSKRINSEILEKIFLDDVLYYEKLKKQSQIQLDTCQSLNINFEVITSKNYPKNLLSLKYPPYFIFYKGILPSDLEFGNSLTIVGTRIPNEFHAENITKTILESICHTNPIIISGLALGCDSIAHSAALNLSLKTGAVLGQGLATSIYPEKNTHLSETILDSGGFLISEIPPTLKINPMYLKLRNRIQVSLGKIIFIMQTSEKGGTMHSVKYALQQHKNIFVWNPSGALNKENNCVKGNYNLLETNNFFSIKDSNDFNEKLKIINKKKLEYTFQLFPN